MADGSGNRKPTGVIRDAKGRVVKGAANLNPKGRPKGIAARIRERFGDDGEKLIDIFEKIALGHVRATARDRMEAAKILLERAHGKTPETHVNLNANVDGGETVASLADLELESLARALTGGPEAPALPPQAVGMAVEDATYEPIPSDTANDSGNVD
jgi:hypothetical protein